MALPLEILILSKQEIHDRFPGFHQKDPSIEELRGWGGSITLERLEQLEGQKRILTFTVEMKNPAARIRLNSRPIRDDQIHILESGDQVRIYLFSGLEEKSLQDDREIMMSRALKFLSQPSIQGTLTMLGDPGTVTSLSESFSGVEEMEVLRGMGTQTWLVRTGISMPAAGLEAPTLKLFVQPEYRAGMEERLRGSRRFQLVNDARLANLMVGNRDFIQNNRPLSPKALFLQVGDNAALLILTENFLLVIAGQKDQLRPGAVLLVGMQVGSEGAVLFEYL